MINLPRPDLRPRLEVTRPPRPGLSAIAPPTHALLRGGAGLLFFQHGLQKLFGLVGGMGGEPGATVPLASLMGAAGILELVGGLLLILGWLTRPVAAVLCLEMLAAFAIAHLPKGGWPLQNGGELPLLYALVFAFLAGHGAGPASVDAWWRRRHPAEARHRRASRRLAA